MIIQQDQLFNPDAVFTRFTATNDTWHHEWRNQLAAEMPVETTLLETVDTTLPIVFNMTKITELVDLARLAIGDNLDYIPSDVEADPIIKLSPLRTPKQAMFDAILNEAIQILNGQNERSYVAKIDYITSQTNKKYELLSDQEVAALTVDDVIVADAGLLRMIKERYKIFLSHKSLTRAELTALVAQKAEFRRDISTRLLNNQALSVDEAKLAKQIIKKYEKTSGKKAVILPKELSYERI